jgi:hypothetical protein
LRIHFWLWRPTRDFVFYTQWTVLRMLHSARNSNQTKPGEEDGCGIPHHPLLHEKYRVTKTTWKLPELQSQEPWIKQTRTQQWELLRLEVLDRDERLISANVFKYTGSNTSLMLQEFARALKLEGKPQE